MKQYFDQVLNTLVEIYSYYMKLTNENDQIDVWIKNNLKYALYFYNCLGALDEIHIDAHISYKKRISYEQHKGILSQKMLVVITFNHRYYYDLLGSKRSANNNRRLIDIVVNHEFSVPEDKYYFVNTRYYNSDYAMIPYWGV